MAYLKDVGWMCQSGHCERPAKKELRTWRNETVGVFCALHAKKMLAQLQAVEDEARAAGHPG